jgi:hypothetical protein
MVESIAEVLVKEERQPEAVPAAVPPSIFLRWWPATPLFRCFLSPTLSIAKQNPRGYI